MAGAAKAVSMSADMEIDLRMRIQAIDASNWTIAHPRRLRTSAQNHEVTVLVVSRLF